MRKNYLQYVWNRGRLFYSLFFEILPVGLTFWVPMASGAFVWLREQNWWVQLFLFALILVVVFEFLRRLRLGWRHHYHEFVQRMASASIDREWGNSRNAKLNAIRTFIEEEFSTEWALRYGRVFARGDRSATDEEFLGGVFYITIELHRIVLSSQLFFYSDNSGCLRTLYPQSSGPGNTQEKKRSEIGFGEGYVQEDFSKTKKKNLWSLVERHTSDILKSDEVRIQIYDNSVSLYFRSGTHEWKRNESF